MPVVDTIQSFATGDTVTSTTLNNIMDQSIFVAGAVVSGSGLAITAGGQMTISNLPGSSITNGTITGGSAGANSKIANNTITVGNLASPSFTWGALPTSGSIELGTNLTSNGSSFIDFHSVFPLTDYEARVVRNPGVDGTFAITNTGTGAITLSASGGVTFGTANMPTPSGSAPVFGCRAWCNFDATVAADISGSYSRSAATITIDTTVDHGLMAGHRVYLTFSGGTGSPLAVNGLYQVASVIDSNSFTVTSAVSGIITGGSVTLNRKQIRGSGNVANISSSPNSPTVPPVSAEAIDNGFYVVNFSTAMPNANFAITCSCNEDGTMSAGGGNQVLNGFAFSDKVAYLTSISTGGSLINNDYNSIMVIG